MRLFTRLPLVLILLIVVFFLSGCGDSDPAPASPTPGGAKLAPLTSNKEILSVDGRTTGSITLTEREDHSTSIVIQIAETSGEHPTHIHKKDDSILFDLANVVNGQSASEVPAAIITFDDLTHLNGGYIAIHISNRDFDYLGRAYF